jgi:hypothetical protein
MSAEFQRPRSIDLARLVTTVIVVACLAVLAQVVLMAINP